jgi:hypothetical protein
VCTDVVAAMMLVAAGVCDQADQDEHDSQHDQPANGISHLKPPSDEDSSQHRRHGEDDRYEQGEQGE